MAKIKNSILDAEKQLSSTNGKFADNQSVHRILTLTSFEEGSEPKSALPPASELLLSRAEAAQRLLDQAHLSNPEVQPVVRKCQMSSLMRKENELTVSSSSLHKIESGFLHATYLRQRKNFSSKYQMVYRNVRFLF
jgi:hypothetical protein